MKQIDISKTFKFLGTGTSFGVPQIGCSCDVCQSNDPKDNRTRCSISIVSESTSIIVDTGPDFRQQCLREKITRIDAVLYTHFHADHIFGLDDLRVFNYLQKDKLPVYMPDFMYDQFIQCFNYTITKPGPGLTRPRFDINTLSNKPFNVHEINIDVVDVNHGETKVKGYVFYCGSSKISYLTDCKSLPPETIEKVKNSDILILSALWNDTNQHPGHLNLQEAIDLSRKLCPETTYFTHLTHRIGFHIETEKLLPNSMHLAYDGLTINI